MKHSLRKWINEWAWQYLCAAWVLCVLLAIYTLVAIDGPAVSPFMSLMVSMWSMKYLLLIPFLLLIPVLQRWWAIGIVLLPILVCFIWQIASLELYAVQCRFLSWSELSILWGTAETRPLITEQIYSWSVLLFVLMFYVGFFGLVFVCDKCIKKPFAVLAVPLICVVVLIGQYYVAQRQELKQQFKPARLAVMPWSWLNSAQARRPIARLDVARELWAKAHQGFWQQGPSVCDEFPASQYKDRSIIIILLESHGVHYLDGFGAGSNKHRASSPYLAQLAREHIYFSNYIQSGYVTQTASWSLLAGFPHFGESAYTPQLARLGLIPTFQKAGYACEWLQSTTTLFAYFNELTHNLGIHAGISTEEAQSMRAKDDSLWSAWGMPDEQLFEVALNRIQKRQQKQQEPFLQILLTVSNHNPYHLPREIDGHQLRRDASGGMRYADDCLRQFMEKINTIDEAERPIVFITADTGFRSVPQWSFDDGNVWAEPLESFRLPGVLVLPGYDKAGNNISDVFSHEDVLPLLAHITGLSHPLVERLQQHQRTATVISEDVHSIMAQDYYLSEGFGFLAIEDNWNFKWVLPEQRSEEMQAAQKRMQQRYQYVEELRKCLWYYEGEGVVFRDQHWEVIDSYEKPGPHDKR